MRKRKVTVENRLSKLVYSDSKIRISKDDQQWYFEIGKEVTSDLAEAVAILMRTVKNDNPVWQLSIEDFDLDLITPEKSLFWLTGGFEEWVTSESYNKTWSECYLEFQQEFGIIIMSSVRKSKKLEELKNYFHKYLNLPILYDFAISKNFVR